MFSRLALRQPMPCLLQTHTLTDTHLCQYGISSLKYCRECMKCEEQWWGCLPASWTGSWGQELALLASSKGSMQRHRLCSFLSVPQNPASTSKSEYRMVLHQRQNTQKIWFRINVRKCENQGYAYFLLIRVRLLAAIWRAVL